MTTETALLGIEAKLSQLRVETKELTQEIEASPLDEDSASDHTPIIFAVALAGLGGLILGVAFGSSYVAPLL